MAEAPARLTVEVAYARPDRQWLIRLELAQGASVATALAAFAAQEPTLLIAPDAAVGIFGEVVDRGQVLQDGDRIEIYRPLPEDPKVTRRRLARAGATMGRGGRR